MWNLYNHWSFSCIKTKLGALDFTYSYQAWILVFIIGVLAVIVLTFTIFFLKKWQNICSSVDLTGKGNMLKESTICSYVMKFHLLVELGFFFQMFPVVLVVIFFIISCLDFIVCVYSYSVKCLKSLVQYEYWLFLYTFVF